MSLTKIHVENLHRGLTSAIRDRNHICKTAGITRCHVR